MSQVDEQIRNHSIVAENFTTVYPTISDFITKFGSKIDSRVGDTLEVLDFKTTLNYPVERCIAGSGRDINIFFLLAEALWIWAGRNDVEFLSAFNKRMADYSDNGFNFNAPYGFRMRHFGRNALESFLVSEKNDQMLRYDDEGAPNKFHLDQIKWVLELLHKDSQTRRAVISIWNPEFDTMESKDIPCNDLLMFKVRNGKLNLTIANRSNDLHWGLCTNVFQFSFVLEIMSRILGLGVGQQTHNSQSLHIYTSNKITDQLRDEAFRPRFNIYDFLDSSEMDFHFDEVDFDLNERIELVDGIVGDILSCLQSITKGGFAVTPPDIPNYFAQIFKILVVYAEYVSQTSKDEMAKEASLGSLVQFHKNSNNECADYYLLALNWFAKRLPEDKVKQILGTEPLFSFDNSWIGKF